MSTVLVAYATKMGGTEGIAEAITDELRSCGLTVDLCQAEAVERVENYDAAVVGSAMYTGRWRRPAVVLLRKLARAAKDGQRVRVWLFQSGPTGPGATTDSMSAPRKVAKLAARLGADLPRTFGGRIEHPSATGFLARKMADSDMGGDYRDFNQVKRWAHDIAVSLSVSA